MEQEENITVTENEQDDRLEIEMCYERAEQLYTLAFSKLFTIQAENK